MSFWGSGHADMQTMRMSYFDSEAGWLAVKHTAAAWNTYEESAEILHQELVMEHVLLFCSDTSGGDSRGKYLRTQMEHAVHSTDLLTLPEQGLNEQHHRMRRASYGLPHPRNAAVSKTPVCWLPNAAVVPEKPPPETPLAAANPLPQPCCLQRPGFGHLQGAPGILPGHAGQLPAVPESLLAAAVKTVAYRIAQQAGP